MSLILGIILNIFVSQSFYFFYYYKKLIYEGGVALTLIYFNVHAEAVKIILM